MRHGKKFNHLSRSADHRKALLKNLAKGLILHKRINTTTAKAKALRKVVEPLLTRAKSDTTHDRRVVFSFFQDKEPVKELFDNIASRILDRPGGYTRIIKLDNRLGDNAEMCMIELVDYNELLKKEDKATATKAKTRRSRRKSTTASEAVDAAPIAGNDKTAGEAVEASQEADANVTLSAAAQDDSNSLDGSDNAAADDVKSKATGSSESE